MSYLADNPEFLHQLLLVSGDALWLVPGAREWTLPGFVGDEQHTAEVDQIARYMRGRFGIGVVVLGRAATEFDTAKNRVHVVDLAEHIVDLDPSSGRWWSRAGLATPDAAPTHNLTEFPGPDGSLPSWGRRGQAS